MKHLNFVFLIFISINVSAQVWVTVGTQGFSDTSGWGNSLVIDSSGTPYIAYSIDEPTAHVSVMKYNGSSWVYVGSPVISAGMVQWTSLVIDKNTSELYLAFQDWANGQKATVMKYNGSSWATLGSPGFSAGIAENTKLALDTNGKPYIAYRDFGNSEKITVKMYNGSTWVNVGSPGFSLYQAYATTIAIDKNNTPYVVYQDDTDGAVPAFYGPAVVMKFNGTSWVNLGSPAFSAGSAQKTTIATDTGGTPYVAYIDMANSGKVTVMKYNGSSWVNVGSPGFSDGSADEVSLAIDGSGTPYVSFEDGGTMASVAVMKYNGSSWVSAGPHHCSTSSAEFTSIAINRNGVPYVAFADYTAGLGGKETVVKLDTSITMTTTEVNNLNYTASQSVVVYPNPATTELTISSNENLTNVFITNLIGQTLYCSKPNAKQHVIDLANLAPGIYLIRINDTEVRKFLKE